MILAPRRPNITWPTSIFLAGTTARTAEGDWREALTSALAHLPVTIFNPLRLDWGADWGEDISCAPFREQVEWELDMQEKADLVVVYLHPVTDAPISLLELGLCAPSGRAIVFCPPGYSKRGNVQVLCHRFGLSIVATAEELSEVVKSRLGSAGVR